MLSHVGVPFQSYNILDDADLRQGLKEFSNWPTFPQLYVKGELVGGCDIVREMYETGELQQLMSREGHPAQGARLSLVRAAAGAGAVGGQHRRHRQPVERAVDTQRHVAAVGAHRRARGRAPGRLRSGSSTPLSSFSASTSV